MSAFTANYRICCQPAGYRLQKKKWPKGWEDLVPLSPPHLVLDPYCERYDQWKDFHPPPPYTVKCWSKSLFFPFLFMATQAQLCTLGCRIFKLSVLHCSPKCNSAIDAYIVWLVYDVDTPHIIPSCESSNWDIMSLCFLLNGALLQQNSSSIWTTLSTITSRLLGKKM